MSLKEFDEFVCRNKDRKVSVTKMKNLDRPAWGTSSVPMGEAYTGQVTLKAYDDGDFSGYRIFVDGGYTLRTTVVRDAVQKSPTRWLAKTLNSVYKVEVVE